MCGFVHSTLRTTPVTLTGWARSNSAEKEWWANAAVSQRLKKNRTMAAAISFFAMTLPPVEGTDRLSLRPHVPFFTQGMADIERATKCAQRHNASISRMARGYP